MDDGAGLAGLRLRELPADEYDRLRDVPPYDQLARPVQPSPNVRIIVADTPGGPILAHWAAFNAVHLEPLWIHPAHRGDGMLGYRLLRAMLGVLDDDAVAFAFAVIAAADEATVRPLAERLGFVKLPGSLYTWERKD